MDKKTQSDIISTLPQNIIDNILCLMPIRDALRTSVLSKKWQYCWQSMPKLVFTGKMVKVSSNHLCSQLKKYKLVSAIFHVLMLHNSPTILVFSYSVAELLMDFEFAQIISYLARGNKVKELYINNRNSRYKLPISFFTLQGLELIRLHNCTFEPPLTFNRFSRLRSMAFVNVEVSAQMLQRFLSNCPLLEYLALSGDQEVFDFVAGENKFTFVDLLQLVPLIVTLDISKYYMKYLCSGGMPHKLTASLAHLKYLYLDLCSSEQNEVLFALCMIRSSPFLKKIIFQIYSDEKPYVQQTSTNFLDPEEYPDLKLDHLEMLEILGFNNLPLEMTFVKFIMAKSPVLKKVRILLNDNVSVDEELKMLRDLVLHPISRASPSAKLAIVRPKTS